MSRYFGFSLKNDDPFLFGRINLMCKRLTKLLGVFLVLGLLAGHVNADLVGNWKFDESARGYILCVEFVQ